MEDWSTPLGILLGLLGISVSVVTYFLGHRHTIGARKERIRSANGDLTNVLFRRISADSDFDLDPDNIRKAVLGWATRYSVLPAELMAVDGLEASLLTRVLESDQFAPGRRRDAIERIERGFKGEYVPGFRGYPAVARPTFSPEARLAVISGLLGLVVTYLLAIILFKNPRAAGLDFNMLNSIGASVAAILATITAVVLYFRLRQRSAETGPKASGYAYTLDDEKLFATSVATELKRLMPGASVTEGKHFTYEVVYKKWRIFVEPICSLKGVPDQGFTDWIGRLSTDLTNHPDAVGILVVKDRSKRSDRRKFDFGKVTVKSFDQLSSAVPQR